MKGDIRKIGRQNTAVWSARLADGKGSKVFVSEDQAEDLLKQGHLLLRRCKVKDLQD